MGLDQRDFKTRPSSYLFQIARGSGATLEIPKNTKIYIYNELFTWDRKVLDKSRKFLKIARRCVCKAKTKARQSIRQVN